MDLVTEYLKLGLRFDRIVDGFVDAYTGDPALRREVADEPAPEPLVLSRRAAALSAAVADTELEPHRAAFMTAHLDALSLAGRRLAGESMSLVDEVAGYFQVTIELIDTDVFADAHARIGELLGGTGPVRDRLAALRAAELCPVDLVEPAVRAVAANLRERISHVTGLAALDEHIDFEIARDVPWSGFNYYLGNFRSRVAVNADIGHLVSQLGRLVAHECYPGHHTEHCRKEDLLVREGLGDLALTAAVGPGWGRWLAQVLDGIGPSFDPDLAEALEIAGRPLSAVRQNAAILLHDRGTDPDEVVAYLQRWALVAEEQARQRMRFLTDPLWRAYTSTYVEGEKLLRPWLDARGPGTSALGRFQRLLDEPLTPALIQAETASAI